MKVSVGKKYAITEYLKKQHPDMDVYLVPDDLSILPDVSFDMSDSAIIVFETTTYFIKTNGKKCRGISCRVQVNSWKIDSASKTSSIIRFLTVFVLLFHREQIKGGAK